MPQRPVSMKPRRVTSRMQRVQVEPTIRGNYDVRLWRRMRRMKLDADPMCVECAKTGIVCAANEVDHIVPVSKTPGGMFDYENLQSLCKQCHSRKTRTEMNARNHGKKR